MFDWEDMDEDSFEIEFGIKKEEVFYKDAFPDNFYLLLMVLADEGRYDKAYLLLHYINNHIEENEPLPRVLELYLYKALSLIVEGIPPEDALKIRKRRGGDRTINHQRDIQISLSILMLREEGVGFEDALWEISDKYEIDVDVARKIYTNFKCEKFFSEMMIDYFDKWKTIFMEREMEGVSRENIKEFMIREIGEINENNIEILIDYIEKTTAKKEEIRSFIRNKNRCLFNTSFVKGLWPQNLK